MIQRLYIKDFAIIDEIELDINPGFTVITGETGSGKSLLLEALGVALGGKTDKIFVKHGAERTVVDATIKQNSIRRIISKTGRSKAYKNDEPLTIADLKTVTQSSVDFHGQHDQQLILDPNRHIEYLDHFCNHDSDVNQLSDYYDSIRALTLKLNQSRASKQERQDRLDLLQFQASEIDAVNPKVGEDELLDKSFKQLTHLEDIIQVIQQLNNQVNTGDNSVVDVLESHLRSVESLSQFDDDLKRIAEYIKSAIIQLQESGAEISNKLVNAEFDQNELKEVEDRLGAIESLKRKYGGSVEAVLSKRESIQKEVKSLKDPGQSEEKLIEEIQLQESKFKSLALKAHAVRKQKALVLSKKIVEAMAKLNMPGSEFDIQISTSPSEIGFIELDGQTVNINSKGIDEVSFYLSANPGEPVKPLASIASGGEISRIMLAIKTVFQNLDPVETLIFDEIDTGISGKAAEKVADQLKSLSKSKQVLCITHLSQIASKADYHLHITKSVNNGKTKVDASYLSKLDRPKIIQELFIGTETLKA